MNWHVNMCELLSEQLTSLSKFCLSFLCAALSSNKIWQKISTTFCKFVSMNGINSMFMSLLRRTSKYASKTVWCYINVHWFAWNLINNGSMYKRQLQSTYCGSLYQNQIIVAFFYFLNFCMCQAFDISFTWHQTSYPQGNIVPLAQWKCWHCSSVVPTCSFSNWLSY